MLFTRHLLRKFRYYGKYLFIEVVIIFIRGQNTQCWLKIYIVDYKLFAHKTNVLSILTGKSQHWTTVVSFFFR